MTSRLALLGVAQRKKIAIAAVTLMSTPGFLGAKLLTTVSHVGARVPITWQVAALVWNALK